MTNHITLAGYVSQVKGSFKTPNGSLGFSFTLAHTEKTNGKEKTVFIPILCWGEAKVQRVEEIGVGDFALVTGKIAQYKSKNKDRPSTRIVAYHVLFNKKETKETKPEEEGELPF